MSSVDRSKEGRAFLAAAEKKAGEKSGGFFRSMLGMSSGKEDEAGELFVKAANSFKLAKSWAEAGDAFTRAAETYESSTELTYDAASKYSDAAKAYKNADASGPRAVQAYQKAIRLYTDAARFQQCARLSKELAELHESNGNFSAALESYTAAGDFYEGEDSKSNANSMRQKVAMISATAGQYAKAASLFEQIARDALDSTLLKYGARELLLKAGLCRLCMGDIVGANRAVESYGEMDSSFPPSREGKLLSEVVRTVEEGDVEAFTNCLYEYDSISKLDEWKTSILVKIKNSIKDIDDDLT